MHYSFATCKRKEIQSDTSWSAARAAKTHLEHPLRLVPIIILVLVTHPVILVFVALRARRGDAKFPLNNFSGAGDAARPPASGAWLE